MEHGGGMDQLLAAETTAEELCGLTSAEAERYPPFRNLQIH